MSLREALGEPRDPAALAAFRVVVGAIVAISAARFLVHGWVDALFVTPRVVLPYPGLGWVPRLPPALAHEAFVALGLLGVAVAAGFLYRASVVALFLLFTWIQLVDVTNYLNHYVLVSLLLGLMSLMPLGRVLAVDAWLWPARRLPSLPAWMTWLFRVQVGCVYVFAARAKLGEDWLLHAQPLGIWLGSRTDVPWLGPWLGARWVAFAFSWAGFLFDATIVPLLLWGRTRRFAYPVLVGFHGVTGLLFPIGMFPVIMIGTATVFFPPGWPRDVAARLGLVRRWEGGRPRPPSRLAVGLGMAFVAASLLVPLRSAAWPGDVRWHERGMRFSWRVMVREKNAVATYHLEDRATGRRWFVRPRELLDDRQEREAMTQPDLVLALGRMIARREAERGRDVAVRADVVASLNGRPPRPLVDPSVDLASLDDGDLSRWILPRPDEPPARAGRSGRW